MPVLCTRKLGGTIDVIGGQAGTIRRVEGRRRDKHASEENPIQVKPPGQIADFTALLVSPEQISVCVADLPCASSYLQFIPVEVCAWIVPFCRLSHCNHLCSPGWLKKLGLAWSLA